MRIAFVGGGTAGHFYPLMAVAEQLALDPKRPRLYYIGPTPYDAELLRAHDIRYVSCPAGKLRRYVSLQNVLDIFRTSAGLFVAIWKLYFIYPDVIFSKGGYTSVPVLLAAWVLRIPIVIHESDAVPGRANTLAKGFARYIAIAHDDAAQYFPKEKTALVGIPIRRELLTPHPDPFTFLNIPSDRPLIYVTGGSLGAERINNLILAALEELLPHYTIVHQSGVAHHDALTLTAQALITDQELQQRYYVRGSLNAITVNALMTAASLIITRAGSTTLFEIALHGKPAIVIPIPTRVSHDQVQNAYSYARTGAATVMEEANLTEHLLAAEIQTIMNDPERYAAMSNAAKGLAPKGAADKIAAKLIEIGTAHGS